MRALSRPFSLLLLAAFTLLSGCAALQDVAKTAWAFAHVGLSGSNEKFFAICV